MADPKVSTERAQRNSGAHTEGPWKVVDDRYDYSIREVATDQGWMYREVCADIDNEADANLICASPELLESCERLLRLVELGAIVEDAGPEIGVDSETIQQDARAAIRKARGQS